MGSDIEVSGRGLESGTADVMERTESECLSLEMAFGIVAMTHDDTRVSLFGVGAGEKNSGGDSEPVTGEDWSSYLDVFGGASYGSLTFFSSTLTSRRPGQWVRMVMMPLKLPIWTG